jgi:hypothetical protein
MKIVPIFTQRLRTTPCNLWAACYIEDYYPNGIPRDVFSKLFEQWNDETYLSIFFHQHVTDLAAPFWNGISIDEAKDQILDEALDFENELKHIELQMPGYENYTLQDIFHQLHKHEFSLKPQFSRFRKGKPNFPDAMLRLYAIELEDGCMVVSGGAIKLTERMNRPHLETENKKLIQVQDFLNSAGIYTREGLI